MAKIIGLPKLSPTMEEGTLVRWVKQEGESVDMDDLVAEVETDKATMEFRSFDRGVLLKQLVEEGTTLEPDQPVAIIGKQGDDISSLVAEAGGAADNGAPAAQSSSNGHSAPAPVQASTPIEAQPTPKPAGGRVLASPLVRKLAREQDIDLTTVNGSGPGGRVIKRDLDGVGVSTVGMPGATVRGPTAPPPGYTPTVRQPSPSAPTPARAPAPVTAPGGPGRSEKLTPMRKTIARRMAEAKQTVPHFYLTIDVDAEPLVSARAQINAELKPQGDKISLNDLLLKACAVALRRVPECNASFRGDHILYHDRVDISVAVAVPGGLVTPVVRNVDQLGTLAIGQQVRDLAGRAKEKKLKPEEMSDGTFSISNLGMFGIDDFSAVINPPEGAILAVSQVREEPVVKDGAVVPGKRMSLTLSCDHRVVDGAVGAQFLKVLRGLLEAPLRMIV